jgi:hypothetical protein
MPPRQPRHVRQPDQAQRWITLLLIALLGLLATTTLSAVRPGSARADGDPASDVLLGTDVFYPYTPVSPADESALTGATTTLRKEKAPIKIALIASPTDLGVIPTLFDHAQQYANFLDTEISFTGPQPLLVVMPNGYGTAHLTPAAVQAVAAAPKPTGAGGDALTLAALHVVDAIGAAEGHPLTGSHTPAPVAGHIGGSSSSSTPIVIGLLVVVLLTAGGLIAATFRRRHTAA